MKCCLGLLLWNKFNMPRIFFHYPASPRPNIHTEYTPLIKYSKLTLTTGIGERYLICRYTVACQPCAYRPIPVLTWCIGTSLTQTLWYCRMAQDCSKLRIFSFSQMLSCCAISLLMRLGLFCFYAVHSQSVVDNGMKCALVMWCLTFNINYIYIRVIQYWTR